MGIVVDAKSNNHFDVLKEIETARANLFNKQQKAKSNVEICDISN
jgi:hypothetical protein